LKIKTKIGDAVFVEWEDSYGCSASWQDIPDSSEPPQVLICRSLGWITAQSKKCLVIVPHIAQNRDIDVKQGCGDMMIPAAAITRIIAVSLGSQSAVNARACDSESASRRKQRRSSRSAKNGDSAR